MLQKNWGCALSLVSCGSLLWEFQGGCGHIHIAGRITCGLKPASTAWAPYPLFAAEVLDRPPHLL